MKMRYLDKNLTLEDRVEDLLKRMTLTQKIAQLESKMFMGNADQLLENCPTGVGEAMVSGHRRSPKEVAEENHKVIDAIMERTGGIPPILHVEAVSGMLSIGATSFPSAIGLGATFDLSLVKGMSTIIRDQMVSTGVRRALSPNMDVARDPRWGRIGETYGEDATLVAAMSVAFVSGLQGEDLTEGAAATGKHFLGYAMGEGGFNSAPNSISPRDLREVYARPFQAAVTEANLQTVMTSYGAPDNEPVAGSKAVTTGLLRRELGFTGVTISDNGALHQLVDKRMVSDDYAAAVRALHAGVDIELQMPESFVYRHLAEALEKGDVTIEQIDNAVRHVLTLKFRLGLFENPYPHIEKLEHAYNDPDNSTRSLRAACESIVLLKNDGILPLKKGMRKLAVIGPRADNIRVLYGGYTLAAGLEMAMGGLLKGTGVDLGGESNEYYPNSCVKRESAKVTEMLGTMLGHITPTILRAIEDACPETEVCFERGCDIAGDDQKGFLAAVELAESSDAVIFAIGGKYGWGEPCTAGEGRDTTDIGLPGVQEKLLHALCETGTPVIIVHGDVRPVSSFYAKEHAAAILETWFPGQTGGTAVAKVLFGEYNPAGRLPVTCLAHAGQIPLYTAQREGNVLSVDQRKQNFDSFSNGIQEPLWYFGEGMSYTRFEYSDFCINNNATPLGEIIAAVTITNSGDCIGEEVVQLYFTDKIASTLRPIRELAGFVRIFLSVGESKRVKFTMKATQTAFLNGDMEWVVEEGEINFVVGASSRDIRASATCRIAESVKINGITRGFFAKTTVQTI